MKCDLCGEEMRYVSLEECVERKLDEHEIAGPVLIECIYFFRKITDIQQNGLLSLYECNCGKFAGVHKKTGLPMKTLMEKYNKLKAFW